MKWTLHFAEKEGVMYTVFLNEFIHPEARKLLEENCRVVDHMDVPEEIDAIILRVFPVDRDVMDKCRNLKVIGKHGVGCNTIDLEEAKRRNVTVLNTPGANANSVAELIVGLMLDISRNISLANRKLEAGEFSTVAPASMTGMELTGKTLGLLGTGNIARRVTAILKNGFDVAVNGYDPFVSKEKMEEYGFKKCDTVEELIAASDIVNVSVPLMDSTRNLISAKNFDCFRKGAILINAARGGIVNEEDLYDALKGGRLRAAACDSFVQEPPSRSTTRLYELDNFVGTPHIGACAEEALYRMGMESVREVISVLNGNEPVHRVV